MTVRDEQGPAERRAASAARPAPEEAQRRAARRPAGPVWVEIRNPRTLPREQAPAPWYFAAPSLFRIALEVGILPFRLLVLFCEVVVCVSFAGLVGVVVGWYFKFIPDAEVAGFISTFSERIQGILKGAGLF